MGRGKQKAKEKRIGREVKYQTPDIDFNQLSKELQAEKTGSEPHREDEDE
jgi:hypothetical protein